MTPRHLTNDSLTTLGITSFNSVSVVAPTWQAWDESQIQVTGTGNSPYLGVSKNRGKTPQIIHFNRVFHYKPSILEVFPLFLETAISLLFVSPVSRVTSLNWYNMMQSS